MRFLNLEKQETVLKIGVLAIAALLSFSTRLFSVLRFESVIHEFDPYFNYRTTRYMTEEGFYDFHNWFDNMAWYPLGRIIGGTIYPGLMITSSCIYRILHFINITIDIRNVCVFLAPLFSSFTTCITFLLTKEVKDTGSGLLAACMVAIVPGYISRSVAGSYDNEGIAIFCMLLTFYLWIKAVKTGAIYWSVLCSLAYFYMVSSWGGYVFLINIIPIHVLILMLCGRFSHRLYTAYSTLYALGTILSMQISFVGFLPVLSSEHLGALGVFGLCQIYAFFEYLYAKLTKDQFNKLLRFVVSTIGVILAIAIFVLAISGKIAPWTGRFYSLLDPSYAKNNIPIIASVSEHQPTAWGSYYFDLQLLAIMFPVGLYYCFKNLTDANIFIITYGVLSLYFSGVMVRLILVLAPVMCILAGIGISGILKAFIHNMDVLSPSSSTESSALNTSASGNATVKASNSASRNTSISAGSGKHSIGGGVTYKPSKYMADSTYPMKGEFAAIVVFLVVLALLSFNQHSIWVTSAAYSSPSIVMSANRADGSQIIFDDYREAYYWLRQNTKPDAKIMSWWDYGYQITAIANRTVLVDNNTWNNTHIGRVGQAMASSEAEAYEIMRELDVDYVLVIFGGMIGQSSDDINKFLWMVRIAGSTEKGKHIKEADYFNSQGEFRIDNRGAPALLNCLLYRLSYYQFSDVQTENNHGPGYDRVRQQDLGVRDFELDTLEEAYTSTHWLVRIFKVKDLANRGVV